MEELQNTRMQTPIEIALQIDESGHTTARALYDFLEMPTSNFARWARQNIEQNEFYDENKDWWGFVIVKNGNNCKDYRLTTDFAKHLCMESHSARGKVAREYFVTVEDKAKEMVINRAQLSPQLQMFYAIAEGQAKMELEQKRLAKEVEEVKQTQTTIAETFRQVNDVENFQNWANSCITKIAQSPYFHSGTATNMKYSMARSESYERLSRKRNCRLDDRVQRAKGRALEERPDIKKAELNKINKLYVIANDKDLRPAYELVIKEMMMCYCTNVKTA